MSKFILTDVDNAVNLDYITAVSVSGSNVALTRSVDSAGGSSTITITCANSTEAQKVFVAITQAFDPKSS
jgi:hypothetical protein